MLYPGLFGSALQLQYQQYRRDIGSHSVEFLAKRKSAMSGFPETVEDLTIFMDVLVKTAAQDTFHGAAEQLVQGMSGALLGGRKAALTNTP